MFSLCSHEVNRSKPTISAALDEDCLTVQDANGVSVAFIYSRDHLHQQKWGNYNQHLTSQEARRVAATIAKLPELDDRFHETCIMEPMG